MEFKIDTKPSYTVVTPVYDTLDAKLTEKLRQKWNELTQSGSLNLIVDLSHCTTAQQSTVTEMMDMHEEMYAQNQSLVFTNPPIQVLAVVKQFDEDHVLNMTPTMKEAIDIVSMELLERELFNEENE